MLHCAYRIQLISLIVNLFLSLGSKLRSREAVSNISNLEAAFRSCQGHSRLEKTVRKISKKSRKKCDGFSAVICGF